MSVTTIQKRYASLGESADFLGVSERTLRRMIATGELRAYRLGKRLVRLDLNELEASLRRIPAGMR